MYGDSAFHVKEENPPPPPEKKMAGQHECFSKSH